MARQALRRRHITRRQPPPWLCPLAVEILWPQYRAREADGGLAAVDFETAVEPSKDDPSMQALKIDYHDVAQGAVRISRPEPEKNVQSWGGAG